MAFNQFENGAVRLNTTLIGGISAIGVPTDVRVRKEQRSGNVHPHAVHAVAADPRITFTTEDIALMIDRLKAEATANGEQLGCDLSGATLTAWATQLLDGSTRAGSAAHSTYAIAQGILIPRMLRASGDGEDDATFDLEAIATYDGTNWPLAVLHGEDLPTAPAELSRFTLGKVEVGGVELDDVTGFELDFGIELRPIKTNGEPFPRIVSIATAKPVITITGVDMADILETSGGAPTGTFSWFGTEAAHADTIIYLRKRLNDDDGTAGAPAFHPDASTVHVQITAAGLITSPSVFEGNTGSAANKRLQIDTKFTESGSVLPLAITTGVAIT